MTDGPLFQNVDEQEAMYAPRQLPAGAAAKDDADADDKNGGNQTSGESVPLVVPMGGILGNGTGGVGVAGAAAGPAVGTTVLGDEVGDDHDDHNRS